MFESTIRYDEECDDELGKECEVVLFDLPGEVQQPIFVFYQLENYNQNFRRYMLSRDVNQLAGTFVPFKDLVDCNPVIRVSDLWPHQ